MDGGSVIHFPAPPKLRLPSFSGWGVLAIIALIWLGSGTYQVGPAQAGVVRRFGRVTEVTGPGLHWHLPWPVEKVDTPDVAVTRRIEVGFRTVRPAPQAQYREVPEEALMLTGDENIVSAEVAVQYQIKDPKQFLFNLKDPETQVRAALEASLRAVVGQRVIDDVLTTGKSEIQTETLRLLQNLLDKSESGIAALVVQLQGVQPPKEASEAFKSVASAKEEKQRVINESETYRNDIIPKARGEAERLMREAEAFRAEQVARARGEASRYLAVLKEYQQGKEVNRTRMYLEAIEQVLQGSEIFIVDQKAGGLVPYLPLSATSSGPAAAPAPRSAPTPAPVPSLGTQGGAGR